jgi:HSP20 family protein
MSLTLWEPLRGLSALHESMDRLFGEALRGIPARRGDGSSALLRWPPVNIHETDEAIVLEADVPGFDHEDIHVEVEDGTLTIKGESRRETDEEREHYRRVERFHGSFHRSFALPGSVDPEGVKARLQNGVLAVTVPKVPEAKRRAVSVETE